MRPLKETPSKKKNKSLESFSTLTISSTKIKTHYLAIFFNAWSKKETAWTTNSKINGREKLEKMNVSTKKPMCQFT